MRENQWSGVQLATERSRERCDAMRSDGMNETANASQRNGTERAVLYFSVAVAVVYLS